MALATRLEPTLELWDFYNQAAAREGYQAGPENFGYLQPVMVADTQERAEEMGKRILYGGAFAHFARPEWMFPPGYNSKAATRRLARTNFGVNASAGPLYGEGGGNDGRRDRGRQKDHLRQLSRCPQGHGHDRGYARRRDSEAQENPGYPASGHLLFLAGRPVPAKDRMRCLELINRDVIPAMREHGKTLGLVDPFEQKPGLRPLANGRPEPVSDAEALAELEAA